MADYTQITDFSAKDSLSSGDPEKLILGSDVDAEFDAIATAVSSKYDSTDIATQAQAEAETVNTTLMTPLRVAQWADANSGIVGDLQALSAPGADQVLCYDFGTTSAKGFTLGTGLSFSGDTIIADIGSDVQAWDANLDQIAALAVTDGNFIVGNGSAWVAESGATARTSLGLGSLATASTINNDNWSGTDLAVANGGTGASTAAAARTALGVAIGSDVQAYDADLAAIAALAKTDGNFIVGNGSAWVAESGATARTSLGLAIGTNVQAWDANLDQIAALAVTDGNIIVGNGSAWVAESGATARTSLGVGTGNSPQFAGIELSHATATTLTGSSGQLLVEGKAAFQHEGAYTSGGVTYSTSAASGGASGDMWFQYTA